VIVRLTNAVLSSHGLQATYRCSKLPSSACECRSATDDHKSESASGTLQVITVGNKLTTREHFSYLHLEFTACMTTHYTYQQVYGPLPRSPTPNMTFWRAAVANVALVVIFACSAMAQTPGEA
jgi:hypothetical protein